MSDVLQAAVSAAVARQGLDLEDVSLVGPGRHRILRVVVDADGGVGIDAIAAVSRELSTALDDTDLVGGGQYTLEVTSRGVSSPLTEPRHWRRNEGRLVRVRCGDDTDLTGRIVGTGASSATLDVAGTEVEVVFETVERAIVQAELNRKDG